MPDAEFTADVTVSDGTEMLTGEEFVKTWRLRSSGCAPWPEGSVLAFVRGAPLGVQEQVSVPALPPGQTADISVPMRAPDEPGTYKSIWQLHAPGGRAFGAPVYVEINVRWPPPRRLSHGTLVKNTRPLDGNGELTIKPSNDSDAVVVLTSLNDQVVWAVYLRAGQEYTLTGIPDGVYRLYFMTGEDWDGGLGRFTRYVGYSRMEGTIDYETTVDDQYIYYQTWEVTLYPVPFGDAKVEDLSQSEFPSLQP